MATASIEQIKKEIDSKKLAPVYLLTGEEPYFIDILSDLFENKTIDQDSKDFNFNMVYGQDASAAMLLNFCTQYPLMSDRRLVILKEAQMLTKSEWAKLSSYLGKPHSTTTLVICNKNKTFDIKTKNLIQKNNGVIFESKKIPDYRLGNWIRSFIKDLGYSYEESAISIIENYLGNNLEKISNEINKILLNLKGRTNITTKDVTSYIGISKEYNVFELQKALACKNYLKCNEIVKYMSQNPKDNPVQMIIPSLFGFFVNTYAASQVGSRYEKDVSQALKLNPFQVKDYITALNYYNQSQLLQTIKLFEQYDLKSKGVNVSPLNNDGELLKELIYNILHPTIR